MTGANRLHVRRRGVAAITAAITALGFVVCSLLAMHHEASTAHARTDAGGYRHVRELAGHHLGNDSDIHAPRDLESEAGDCALLTTFHQATSARISAPSLMPVTVAHATVALLAPHVEPSASAVYRLAPKTSPPASV